MKINCLKLVCFLFSVAILGFSLSCSQLRTGKASSEPKGLTEKVSDTVRIANDSLSYEIIIIDPGFNRWINSVARSRGYYSQGYLERRNAIFVNHWNMRVMDTRYNRDLYLMRIDYDPQIDYGYEVNYLLYNYFLFFQRQYDQQLGPFLPRLQ